MEESEKKPWEVFDEFLPDIVAAASDPENLDNGWALSRKLSAFANEVIRRYYERALAGIGCEYPYVIGSVGGLGYGSAAPLADFDLAFCLDALIAEHNQDRFREALVQATVHDSPDQLGQTVQFSLNNLATIQDLDPIKICELLTLRPLLGSPDFARAIQDEVARAVNVHETSLKWITRQRNGGKGSSWNLKFDAGGLRDALTPYMLDAIHHRVPLDRALAESRADAEFVEAFGYLLRVRIWLHGRSLQAFRSSGGSPAGRGARFLRGRDKDSIAAAELRALADQVGPGAVTRLHEARSTIQVYTDAVVEGHLTRGIPVTVLVSYSRRGLVAGTVPYDLNGLLYDLLEGALQTGAAVAPDALEHLRRSRDKIEVLPRFQGIMSRPDYGRALDYLRAVGLLDLFFPHIGLLHGHLNDETHWHRDQSFFEATMSRVHALPEVTKRFRGIYHRLDSGTALALHYALPIEKVPGLVGQDPDTYVRHTLAPLHGYLAEDTRETLIFLLVHRTRLWDTVGHDLNSPATVDSLVTVVDSTDRLDALYLLSAADRFNVVEEHIAEWDHVEELYRHARLALTGENGNRTPEVQGAAADLIPKELLASRYFEQPGAREFFTDAIAGSARHPVVKPYRVNDMVHLTIVMRHSREVMARLTGSCLELQRDILALHAYRTRDGQTDLLFLRLDRPPVRKLIQELASRLEGTVPVPSSALQLPSLGLSVRLRRNPGGYYQMHVTCPQNVRGLLYGIVSAITDPTRLDGDICGIHVDTFHPGQPGASVSDHFFWNSTHDDATDRALLETHIGRIE